MLKLSTVPQSHPICQLKNPVNIRSYKGGSTLSALQSFAVSTFSAYTYNSARNFPHRYYLYLFKEHFGEWKIDVVDY